MRLSTWSRSRVRAGMVGALATLGLVGGMSVVQPAAAQAGGPYAAGTRVDLRVLVLSDGTAWVDAVRAELLSQGVPVTTVDLADPSRPAVTREFLSDTVGDTPRARFQAVVTADQDPGRLRPEEGRALETFESTFGIRRVEAFTLPNPAMGLNPPAYSGPLDGRVATVTAEGRADAFRYLAGEIRFEDNSPTVDESFGYLATPVPGAALTPMVTMPVPGSGERGVLVGAYTVGGRERLAVNFAYGNPQTQFRVLAPGIVNWMTRGVHLGYQRNYLSVHIDDTFSFNGRWSIEHNCTPGEGDCPPGVPPTTPIRMTPEDVSVLADWQDRTGITLDQYFNSRGSVEQERINGSDPLAEAFLRDRDRFRWGNHTFGHLYLGCERDHSVIPWRCHREADGSVRWVSKETILHEIQANLDWARAHGVSVDRTLLLSGEHSGMRILPQQPEDNPHFLAALREKNITVLGADASRDLDSRQVGPSRTISRYPISLFFNVGTAREQVDEYNWIYTSRADGGSGLCEDQPEITSCITPLDLETGLESHILPLETELTMRHVVNNDPRPHYLHQNNIAEERLAYPLLDAVLARHRSLFGTAAPLVNPSMDAAADIQGRHRTWRTLTDAGRVTAYIRDDTVTVSAPAGSQAPITVPEGTRLVSVLGVVGAEFGEAYGGFRSAWREFGAMTSTQLLRVPVR